MTEYIWHEHQEPEKYPAAPYYMGMIAFDIKTGKHYLRGVSGWHTWPAWGGVVATIPDNLIEHAFKTKRFMWSGTIWGFAECPREYRMMGFEPLPRPDPQVLSDGIIHGRAIFGLNL